MCWLRCSVVAGSLFAVLLSLVWGVGRTPTFKRLHIARPEPTGLGEALRSEKSPTLTQEELKTLEEDGVIIVRGLVKDPKALIELRTSLWHHAQMPFEETPINQRTWLYNGAMRALLRDGPLGHVMHQVFDAPYVGLTEAPVWGWPGIPEGEHVHDWHVDARPGQEIHSIWLILTDSELRALEFVRGSHKARSRIEDDCAKPVPGEKMGFKRYDSDCVASWEGRIQQELGLNGTMEFSVPMVAGDAYIFSGHTLHRGFKHQEPRLAVSGRFTSHDHPLYQIGGICNQFAPHCYPPTRTRKDVDCMGWVLFPGVPRETPWLPGISISEGLLRMLSHLL